MSSLNNLKIPRKIAADFTSDEIEVHGFADASEHRLTVAVYT